MSNRVYQLVAVATLVGAPIIVHVISSAVPSVQQAVHNSEEEREGPVQVDTGGAKSATRTPPPPPPAQQSIQPNTNPALSAAPAFDAQGIAPVGMELSSDAPPPPAPVRAPPPAPGHASADDIVVPPPARPSVGIDR